MKKIKDNLKDFLTTVCGGIVLICAGVVGAEKCGMVLPPKIMGIVYIAGGISGSVIAYLTGKNPNGTTKTPEQVQTQNPVDGKQI